MLLLLPLWFPIPLVILSSLQSLFVSRLVLPNFQTSRLHGFNNYKTLSITSTSPCTKSMKRSNQYMLRIHFLSWYRLLFINLGNLTILQLITWFAGERWQNNETTNKVIFIFIFYHGIFFKNRFPKGKKKVSTTSSITLIWSYKNMGSINNSSNNHYKKNP